MLVKPLEAGKTHLEFSEAVEQAKNLVPTNIQSQTYPARCEFQVAILESE